MTFEDILDQAIAILQRRGRLTYRTLRRQFQLDDETLADLKEELIKGQRLAADENGDVLVWLGAAGATARHQWTVEIDTDQHEYREQKKDCAKFHGLPYFSKRSIWVWISSTAVNGPTCTYCRTPSRSMK